MITQSETLAGTRTPVKAIRLMTRFSRVLPFTHGDRDRGEDQRAGSDRGSCTLGQLALAALLVAGRYDRHLRRMRTVHAARRSALTGAFARHAPRVQLTGLAAGFQAVAPLPPGAIEPAIAGVADLLS